MPTDSAAAIGDRMVAFLDVPRTGGIHVSGALQDGLGEQVLWHAAVAQGADRAGQPYEDYVRSTPEIYAGRRVMAGHFHCDDALVRHCPRPVIFAGVVREPLERALSLYDDIRTRPLHPRHAELIQRTLAQSIHDFADIRDNFHNAQLMQLFRAQDRFQILRKVASQPYLVGRHDHLDAFWDVLKAVLGLRNALPHVNRIGGMTLPAGLLATEHQADFGEAMVLLHGLGRTEVEFYRAMPRLIISPWLREALKDGLPPAGTLSPP